MRQFKGAGDARAWRVLTQNALDRIVLDELDVPQFNVDACGLNKGVSLVFLLNHHVVRKSKAWCTSGKHEVTTIQKQFPLSHHLTTIIKSE